jgi:Predicted phosphohydrolase (DHH superfamily)
VLLAVIAHRDLDGLVSAAVIISSRLSNNARARYWLGFAQPHELPRVLTEVAALSPPPSELFIVDVAADSSTWSETRSILERLILSGVKVAWIDHHPSTLRRAGELRKLGVVAIVKEAGSAATLARRFIPQAQDPEFFEKLVRVAEAFDNAEALEEPLSSALEVLADAIALEPTDDAFRRQIVAAWLKGRVLVPEDAVMRSEEAARIFEDLLRKARSGVVLETEYLRVIDLRPARVRGFAGKTPVQAGC